MKKNIIILGLENGNLSGVVRYIQMLTKGLKSQSNINISIISLDTNQKFLEMKVIEEGFIAVIPFPSGTGPLRNELYWLTKYFNAVSDLLLPYLRDKTSIIWHVQDLSLVKLAGIMKTSMGGYILTHLHIIPWKLYLEYDEDRFKKMYSRWLKRVFDLIDENQIEKIAYSLSDKIICVSSSAMTHIVSTYNINSNKIEVIYNGLYSTNEILPKVKKKVPELLFVGRISREKGVISLLNALEKVYSCGCYCKLKLAGKYTDNMLSYIRYAYRRLDLEMLGTVSYDKLRNLYLESTIGIVPSLHEQCSYVAIEMSMFGMPMIVSDVDALSEMFEDEVNALKIPLIFDDDFGLELDEEKLASAIIRLIDDEALRQKLSANAMKNYQEKFTLERMIENTISVYEQLIEQNNA